MKQLIYVLHMTALAIGAAVFTLIYTPFEICFRLATGRSTKFFEWCVKQSRV